MPGSPRLKEVADPNNFLRGTSPYRVAMKEGSQEYGPTQGGYPQEITEALNATVTSLDGLDGLMDLAVGDDDAEASLSLSRSGAGGGLDRTVNAGRLGSLLVDESSRGMSLEGFNRSSKQPSIAASFLQEKGIRLQSAGSSRAVFSAQSMPELPKFGPSSANALRDRRSGGRGNTTFVAQSGGLSRPAPALLRGRPMALRMVPASLRRAERRNTTTQRPYILAEKMGEGDNLQVSSRWGHQTRQHWSEEIFDPSNVSVSYV